jgi:predicted peptidase
MLEVLSPFATGWRWSLLAGLALSSLLPVQGWADAPGTNEFLTRIYTNAAKQTLPYRLLTPRNYDPKKSYPVILYLHGAAARGKDNAAPLNWGPRFFLDATLRGKHDFFLVVPQCPRPESWLESSWFDPAWKESASLNLALELVRDVLPKEFGIDPMQRYLTGVSMGGHAVWVVLIRRPGMFAAAVPVCSGGDAKTVTREAARCPVWAFHSDDDPFVPVQQARDLVKAWRAHGGTAKYTEYTGLKHSSWTRAYLEPQMFDWLFQQRGP